MTLLTKLTNYASNTLAGKIAAMRTNCRHRQIKYLNNIQEQDHRFIKRLVKNNQWFQSFQTAKNTLAGYEAMHMIRKGQVRYLPKDKVLAQKQFIENLFGIAA